MGTALIRLLDGKILMALALVVFLQLVFRLYNALVVKPRKLRQTLKEQGIDGPKQTLLLGNIREIKKAMTTSAPNAEPDLKPIRHDWSGATFPCFELWRKQYGKMFVFALGNTQTIYVTQPNVVRDITTCISLDLGKPSYQQKELGLLVGQGILSSNGAVWAHQRKILAPELYMDKVKGMLGLINESTSTLVIKSWKSHVEAAGGVAEINVDKSMRSFSGDVVSRACFGSNYAKGKEIFVKLNALEKAMSKRFMSGAIPGMRDLPTKGNREVWALEKEVRTSILQVVNQRKEASSYEKDLLQTLLESAKDSDLSQEATDRFIVDNCKNIYLAGYETTAVSANWCLMLLASNPDWQDCIRREALEVCSSHLPDSDMLRKMKQVTQLIVVDLNMVIHESLRLYPPVPIISREVVKEMKFGDFKVPKGVNLWSLVHTLHTDPEVWGPDSLEFKPERFADGISGACKFPHMYMPFGVGPRVCLGQHLAMTELKILLSQIVCNFSFTLSQKYVHSPVIRLVIKPEFGVNLLLKKL